MNDRPDQKHSDKPVAIFVTTLIIAPLMLLCCVAPFVVIAAVSGAVGWVFGSTTIATLAVILAVGAAIAWYMRRHFDEAGKSPNERIPGREQ
jgi:membrane protein YdbS with pleckstrin-like domain